MDTELDTWHRNRSFFIDAGPCTNFNIPKFHSLLHYSDSIRWLGTTDNYNTKTFERLHIDFTKEGWRASNKRDFFPQMAQWLSRQEKIHSFDYYRSWVDSDQSQCGSSETNLFDEDLLLQGGVQIQEEHIDLQSNCLVGRQQKGDGQTPQSRIQIAKSPSEPHKSLNRIVVSHGAPAFIVQLKLFICSLLPIEQQPTRQVAIQSPLPFAFLDIWHQIKFMPENLFDDSSDVSREVMKAAPLSKGIGIPRYDTVIVMDTDEAESTSVIGNTRILSLPLYLHL